MSETNGCKDCVELQRKLQRAEEAFDEAKHRIADLLKVGNIKNKNRLLVEQQAMIRNLTRQNDALRRALTGQKRLRLQRLPG